MILAGKRYFAIGPEVPLLSFGIAVLISTVSILSIGFVIASIVPTARFAQPIGALVFYPMIGLSGLFVPIDVLPAWLRVVTRALPLPYAVSLLQGIWRGDGWGAHLGEIAALAVVFALGAAISSRVFRWE
jgi:ABC-2 type transport system permease protein